MEVGERVFIEESETYRKKPSPTKQEPPRQTHPTQPTPTFSLQENIGDPGCGLPLRSTNSIVGAPSAPYIHVGGPHDFARSANSWGTLAAAATVSRMAGKPRGAAKGARTFRPYWPGLEFAPMKREDGPGAPAYSSAARICGVGEESCGNPCANPGAVCTTSFSLSLQFPLAPFLLFARAARTGRPGKIAPQGRAE